MKVGALAVATLVVCAGCARAARPSPQAVAAPPAAPTVTAGEPPVSEVAPAIDSFTVEMAEARVVRGRLIAREGACDKYCWARVEVTEVVSAAPTDELRGEIRVAHASGGPGIPIVTSTLYLAPYNRTYPPTRLWRLVKDGDPRAQPTPSQVALGWVHALTQGDAAWLSELTARPFSFRRVDESRRPQPGEVTPEAACSRQLASSAAITEWLDCLLGGEDDQMIARTLGSSEPKAVPGLGAAPTRLRQAAQAVDGANLWVHVTGEDGGARYHMLLSFTAEEMSLRVSSCLMEMTLSAEGRREWARRSNYRAVKRAIGRNDLAEVRRLLRAGMAPDEVGNDFAPGQPPISMAAAEGRLEIVEILLTAGADPNACCCSCVTALHEAIIKQHVPVVVRLLRAKADPRIPFDGRQSTVDLARRGGNRAIIRMVEDSLRRQPEQVR